MHALFLFGLLLLQQQPTTPTGSISGQLVYADGQPANGVGVVAVPILEPGQAGGNAVARTGRVNVSGGYRITNLSPGRYYLRTAPPEPGTYYPGVPNEGTATVVTVTNAAIENVNFFLTPATSGVRVAGRLTFPENQPTPLTPPAIEISGNSQPARSVPMAPDGTFEISHVRPGPYNIRMNPSFDPIVATQRIVVADSDLTGLVFNYPKLTMVTGTIGLDAGSPRPRMVVRFAGTPFQTQTAVQPDGTFAVQLPAGEYSLQLAGLAADQYLRSMVDVAADSTADLTTSPLRIAASAVSKRIIARIGTSPGVRVIGRVTSTEPTPPASRRLFLANSITNQTVEGEIDEGGSFELANVMPGNYAGFVNDLSGLPSPRISVVIPEKDVRDLVLEVPGLRELTGRITVDGYGPPPKFSFMLLRGTAAAMLASASSPSELPTVVMESIVTSLRGPGAPSGVQVLQVNVNALPDGTFKLKLPIGEYRIAARPGPPNQAAGIPPAYFLRSINYGSAHLLSEPLVVSSTDSPELQANFGTTAPNPWVKLSGKVTGLDSAKGPSRVALEGNTTSAIETPVNADGSFEFRSVLKGSMYTVRLLPTNDAAPAPRVTVADKDVTGVEIAVPSEKEVTVRTVVEKNGPLPSFALLLQGSTTSLTVLIKPESDGTFKVKLPQDERKIRLNGLPFGYSVKSLSYSSADLMKEPLKIAGTEELRVTFALDPAIPFGSLKGRLTGLDPEMRARLVLVGASSYSSFETPINADGSFSFSNIPQGAYTPTLADGAITGRLTPSSIVVTGTDLTGIEIAVPRQTAMPTRPPILEGPSGTTVSDFASGGSREAANESAAVASLRTINTALVTFLYSSGGKYGGLPDLVNAGLLDSSFTAGPKSGFNFSIIAIDGNYVAAAIPASEATARYGYYSTPDAVVRYSTVDFLAPPRQGSNPVQ